MTSWQWRVVMALVRYVLAKEGNYDIGDAERQQRIIQADAEILLEAAVRYNDE